MQRLDPKCVAAAVACLLVAFLGSLGHDAYARSQQKKQARRQQEEQSYGRPPLRRPIRPVIPSANRYQTDKVFLENADSLYRTPMKWSDTTEYQILKGNVRFRQAGMWMYCDSAYYYPELNSLDAFSNVRMEQGDTLFVYAHTLFYDGDGRMARLRAGSSCQKVRLINRDVTLTTDSLDYDLAAELGWYACGGTIDDKVNTLTSVYGEYSPASKNADFYHDVVLVNNRDGFTMRTDTLYYNTDTHLARIVSKTEITGENDTILTSRGVYDTQAGNAQLTSRSIILHRDSNMNVTTLEGDSIIYDKATRISRAYMSRDPLRHPLPMVLTDTAHKSVLVGGFGLYNDSTREAWAAEYPMLIEYSQGDSLFLRADTIKTYIITRKVWPDSLLRAWSTPDTLAASGRAPLPSSAAAGDSIAAGEELALMPADSLPPLPGHPDMPLPPDSLPAVVRDSSLMVDKEFHVAWAYNHGRFFRQDLQGVADTLVFVECDSMLHMLHKPVVWSGERQVFGNVISVHFNDSTADWALLPESGMMAEYIDEDFYNQLAGKRMLATFENSELKRLDVSGNVEAIFLPMEKDSTYNRMVNAESSFLTIDMAGRDLEKLKMWPEVSGTVTPLFLVKRSQQYLQKFVWLEAIRPKREWYGDRLHWADDLGEISDDLATYLSLPPLFPETFEERPVLPEMPATTPADAPEAALAAEETVETAGTEEGVSTGTGDKASETGEAAPAEAVEGVEEVVVEESAAEPEESAGETEKEGADE